MIQKLKHLKYFKTYIAEQEMPAEEGAIAAAPAEPIYAFIFIEDDDDKDADYTYPDGSSSKDYPTYEIKKLELDAWIEKNIVEEEGLAKSAVDVKRKAFIEFIAGVKSGVTPDDKKYIEKFKNAVVAEAEARKVQDTQVIFSPKSRKPTTDSVDVTFIQLPKK